MAIESYVKSGAWSGLLLVLFAGCALPAPPGPASASGNVVTLTVDRTQYRAGNTMVLTLRNGTAQNIGYNLCGAGLDRRVGTEWQQVQPGLAEVCTLELRTLAPGGSATYRHTVPSGLAPGEYRVRSAVESPLGASWVAVHSSVFAIAN
jgi:hypothetical protein